MIEAVVFDLDGVVIQTEEIWDVLEALGCDSAQGWYVSRPLPAERATEWLFRHPSRARSLRMLLGGASADAPAQPVTGLA